MGGDADRRISAADWIREGQRGAVEFDGARRGPFYLRPGAASNQLALGRKAVRLRAVGRVVVRVVDEEAERADAAMGAAQQGQRAVGAATKSGRGAAGTAGEVSVDRAGRVETRSRWRRTDDLLRRHASRRLRRPSRAHRSPRRQVRHRPRNGTPNRRLHHSVRLAVCQRPPRAVCCRRFAQERLSYRRSDHSWVSRFFDHLLSAVSRPLTNNDRSYFSYPCFENPYPMDIHESPVTACFYLSDCPFDLIGALTVVGKKQRRQGFSEKVGVF